MSFIVKPKSPREEPSHMFKRLEKLMEKEGHNPAGKRFFRTKNEIRRLKQRKSKKNAHDTQKA